MIRSDRYSIVTVNVLYFLPDYHDLVGEFLWQTFDMRPHYPRVHRFLNFWHREIDAVIKEIIICDAISPPIVRAGTIYEPTKYPKF